MEPGRVWWSLAGMPVSVAVTEAHGRARVLIAVDVVAGAAGAAEASRITAVVRTGRGTMLAPHPRRRGRPFFDAWGARSGFFDFDVPPGDHVDRVELRLGDYCLRLEPGEWQRVAPAPVPR
jgi:hypothetical protein